MMQHDNQSYNPASPTLDAGAEPPPLPLQPPPLPTTPMIGADGFEHAPDGHIVIHGPVTGDHPAPTPPPLPASEIFDQGTSFAQLGLRNSVLKGIEAMGFKQPTSIQSRLIPVILSGRDVIGQAKTGTGKTAAFGLPLYHMATRNLAFQSLILAPTRELAIQISQDLQELGKFTPIQVAPIYGGQRISSQASKLRKDPEIIVGTPGRVMDMVERGMLHFNNIRFAVLDEVDRMLDIGFREDIRKILGKCPPPMKPDGTRGRQTIFVSATLSPEIEKLARSYMHDPEKLHIAAGSLTVSLVKQFHLPVAPWDKKRLLKHLLTHEEPALTLVFCRLKRSCDELARYLSEKGIDAHAIHADLGQGKRNQVMAKLRSGQLEVLIASDLASRGIDVEGITHVINYDLPDDIELYVHRIGRTARAGRGGVAWSFVTQDQGGLLTDIERHINAEIPKLDYPDFEPGPLPDWVAKEREQKERNVASKGNRFATPTAPAGPAMPTPAAAPGAPQAAPPIVNDPSKFPGGIIPTKLPPRRMQGRVKTRGR
jgi:ATP-dependent RNA helicase DeaD